MAHSHPNDRIGWLFRYDLEWSVEDIRPSHQFDATCQGTVRTGVLIVPGVALKTFAPGATHGPECREAFGRTVSATGWDDLAGAISPARPGRPSAARKRACSIPRVFGSIGDGRCRDRRGVSDYL